MKLVEKIVLVSVTDKGAQALSQLRDYGRSTPDGFLCADECGACGSTMLSLINRGLAERKVVSWSSHWPKPIWQYRATKATLD